MKKLFILLFTIFGFAVGYSQTQTDSNTTMKINYHFSDTCTDADTLTYIVPARQYPFSYEISYGTNQISGTTLDTMKVYVKTCNEGSVNGQWILKSTTAIGPATTGMVARGEVLCGQRVKVVHKTTGTQSSGIDTDITIYRRTN